jgi:hypothetical protein
LLSEVPTSDKDLAALRTALLENPLLRNRVISEDTKATAIYVPLEPSANGREIAGRIREMLPKSNSGDQFFLAGDPIARDTFGYEMFQQMGLFSPVAGMVMCFALWLMFRSWSVVIANMAVAMISIVWAMGLFIGLGFPVHIASSMAQSSNGHRHGQRSHLQRVRFRYGEVDNKRQRCWRRWQRSAVRHSFRSNDSGGICLARFRIDCAGRVFGLTGGIRRW